MRPGKRPAVNALKCFRKNRRSDSRLSESMDSYAEKSGRKNNGRQRLMLAGAFCDKRNAARHDEARIFRHGGRNKHGIASGVFCDRALFPRNKRAVRNVCARSAVCSVRCASAGTRTSDVPPRRLCMRRFFFLSRLCFCTAVCFPRFSPFLPSFRRFLLYKKNKSSSVSLYGTEKPERGRHAPGAYTKAVRSPEKASVSIFEIPDGSTAHRRSEQPNAPLPTALRPFPKLT